MSNNKKNKDDKKNTFDKHFKGSVDDLLSHVASIPEKDINQLMEEIDFEEILVAEKQIQERFGVDSTTALIILEDLSLRDSVLKTEQDIEEFKTLGFIEALGEWNTGRKLYALTEIGSVFIKKLQEDA